MKTKEIRGITLISLVVMIIVLLILAGVSLSMLTGENGIIKNAMKAKENTELISDLEYLQLKATEALIDYYQTNTIKNENEYILDKWNSDITDNIDVNSADKTIIYKGKVYSIYDIIGNESEKNKLKEENLKQITIANAEKSEDKELLANGKVRIILEEKNGMKAAIPNGFFYVTGKPSDGLVISDRYGDDDNNSIGGNQFVWIPCSEDINATLSENNGTEVTYEKINGLATTRNRNYGDKQYYYKTVDLGSNAGKDIVDWKDKGGNLDSVKKYKGFYIARYEAGLPTDENLWEWKNNAIYGWTNNQSAGSLNGERNTNIDTMVPVSKKNNASWNRVSQQNAKILSEKMYAGSLTVTSSLVDSYAWDTILAWYKKMGINCEDSTSYGNYLNSKLSLKNMLYAVHIYHSGGDETGDKDRWKTYADKYILGNIEIEKRNPNVGTDRTIYELPTGALDITKKNNIYDLAGNMWEWTTEIGEHKIIDSTTNKVVFDESNKGLFAVLRGGGFNIFGSTYSVAYSVGNHNIESYDIHVGFRVVLYINL